jgi:hypothetical protein
MLVVPSVLDAVTVHADGALCTRVATLPVGNGPLPTQVRINGLPLGLNAGSLRAAVLQGPAGLSVRDIRPGFDVQLPPEADVPLEQRALEQAEDALGRIDAQLWRNNQELELIKKLKPSFLKTEPGQPPREASPTAVLTMGRFVDEHLAAIYSRKLELEQQRRDTVAEIQLRRERLNESSSAVRSQRAVLYRAAIITLSEATPAQGETRLALEYAVRGARWVPGYELRMPRSLDTGTLRMRASVLQRTGEDWTNVKLSLSTAELHRRADVPELKSLRIGRRQPPPARSGWREPPPGLEELFTGYDAASRFPPPKPEPQAPKRSITAEIPAADFPPEEDDAPSGSFGNVKADALLPEPEGAEETILQSAPMAAPVAAAPMPAKPMPKTAGSIAPGAPPPPPRMAAPTGAAAPMRARGGGGFERAKKKASLLGGLSKDLARAPASGSRMEMREQAEDMDEEMDGGIEGFGGASYEPEPAPEPDALQPAGSLLDYDTLELAAANQPGTRGKLQPRPIYSSQELIALTAVHVQVDIVSLLAVRQQHMDAVYSVPPPTWAVPPRQSTPHFDYRYDVETRMDVPSDGAWHTVSVFSAPVGLTAVYLCVPSLEPQVFRTVMVENRTPHALLAGPVDVTLGDEFLMTSPLPTLAPGATQRLGLGVEESIKVSRNTRFDEASGGVFGGATMLTHRVSVEVANRLGRPVTVELRERVPVVPTSEKDIKVEEAEVKPAWRPPSPLPGETPVDGERAWRVTLQAGEKQSLDATWVVRIPSSKMLQGGNRRT